jgi:hypothetical protein
MLVSVAGCGADRWLPAGNVLADGVLLICIIAAMAPARANQRVSGHQQSR